jgi:hypothetical protein
MPCGFGAPSMEASKYSSFAGRKYGKPRFAVHFGTCPASGLSVRGKRIEPAAALPGWLPDSGSLQPRPGASSSACSPGPATIQAPVREVGPSTSERGGGPVARTVSAAGKLLGEWRSWSEHSDVGNAQSDPEA